MKLRLHTICAALVISLNCMYAQYEIPGMITGLLEDISSAGESVMVSEFAEEITFLLENPVHINYQDEREIKRLFFLTVFQVRSIIEYTKANGDILSAIELGYLPGFDKELAELVDYFVDYMPLNQAGNLKQGMRLRSVTNIITGNAENDSEYANSNYKLLTRLYYSSGPLEAFLTIDKDKGEPLLLENYKPDFMSASLVFSPEGPVKNIIIGDYKVRFGQGLTVWNGFSRSPLPTEQVLMKRNSSISPNRSSDENDFFRGIALSATIGKTNILSFASINDIDATTVYDEPGGKEYIRSFYYTGIHNTLTTMLKRNSVRVNSFGLNINRMNKNLYLGLNGVYSNFSIPVLPSENTRDYYDFRGNTNYSFSFDYAYLFRSSYIFGEFAISDSHKPAFLQGISLNPEGRVRCNLLYTRTVKGFNSFYGNASGLSTFNKPAVNIIANISAEIWSGLKISSGILHKKELWFNNISGGLPATIKYLVAIRYRPTEYFELQTDIKHQVSDSWDNPRTGIKTGSETAITNVRLTTKLTVNDRFRLQTRLEKVSMENKTGSGFLCYLSPAFTLRHLPLEFRGRLTVFNTDNYDTRIYSWEDDLLYNPVIRPFYEQGSKSYLMVIFKPVSCLSIRAKYSVTLMDDRYERAGQVKEYKLQVVLNL